MHEAAPIRTNDHGISASDIDPDAAKVLRRLHQFGYHAYLVGGGVRDLLLGVQPKDFDVATSARPNEVRRIFRNSRLIGRRFRLAHILFAGGKVIETATFRAKPSDDDDTDDDLITDDNEFGTPESDANRRDFTVNALFYDPATDEVIDYVGGLADLSKRHLRTIGDPGLRFREDPVRMLRAVKFAARLDLTIGAPELAAIRAERNELQKAAVPRLLEEVLRMLYGGAAAESYRLLGKLGLLELLMPEVAAFLGRPGAEDAWHPLTPLLEALDDRCGGQPAFDNGVLLAALFWPLYRAVVEALPRRPHVRQLRPLAEAIIGPAAVRLRIPRRDVGTLLAALEGQLRFHDAHGRKSTRAAFARSPWFPAANDLFELRLAADDVPAKDARAWKALTDEFPPPSVEERREGRRARRRERRESGGRRERGNNRRGGRRR
ncbi:MAG: polynucleotide adenylyltransferase PcnB [Myxococcales bacterium]|nr:polynucleotide adenylyltransferase PcnB [Myxococcales bacterium]